MRNKTTLTLMLLFSHVFLMLNAQTNSITGTVKDANDIPLPGVNIVVKDTNTGVVTNFDGEYAIEASIGDVLVFSYVGLKKKEIKVSKSVINVKLEEKADILDEVVVTAFGVKQATRELGYSVTNIESEDINTNGQTDALSGLQGRAPGVQINKTSGGTGGGIDILIRGVSSVNPNRNNQPLIIIDGLAINNDTFSGSVLPSSGSNSPGSSEQFSFTNRASDINPSDIKSYNILKGAAATALYGNRAANGAIIITTKKGKLGKAKVGINVSTTVREINTEPELQTKYREGFRRLPRKLYKPESQDGFDLLGDFGFSFWSWGPEYSADSAVVDGETIDLTNDRYYDPYNLFDTGINTQIDFNISGATEKMSYYFSVGNNSEKGVLPNTDYDKTTLRFKGSYKVNEEFNIKSSINYTNSGGKRGNGGDKSTFSSLSYYSGTYPINDYINPDGSQRNFTAFLDNPRYLLEKSPLIDDVNRWIGNVTFNWSPKDWINVTYSAQVDNYSDLRDRFVPPELDVGSGVNGFIVNQNINFLGLESNLLASFDKNWSEDFSTTLTLGNQISDSKRVFSLTRGENINVPGIKNVSNFTNIFANKNTVQLRNVGVFGKLRMDYKNQLFLTVTGRNDWDSTLPKKNRSFFYPSVSLAYDFHKLIDKDSDFFTFGKLRGSWAQVGKGPLFGQVGQFFVTSNNFPFDGTGGFNADTFIGDTDIEPEISESFEIGADLRFFDNKLRIDYAYYNTRIDNQIFTVNTAYTSGLAGITRNAGDFETYGHELLLSYKLLDTNDLKWEAILNWSTNEGKVLSLPEDVDGLIFANSGFAGVTSEIRPGGKTGDLFGYKWRTENGQRYIGDDGLPRVDLDERVKVGNAFPDFIASINNTFRYKNFGFRFLLEWKEGGDLYDSARRNGIRNGTLQSTVVRGVERVFEGVMDDGNGGFVTNTTPGLIDQDYYRSSTKYNRASEVLVQDASWVKLRNIGLTYNFSEKLLKTLKVDNLSFTASASNILIWTPFDGFDPEGNQFSAGSNVYGFTGLTTPISESYSFAINLGF